MPSVVGKGNSQDDEKSLVRELLAERFHLTIHSESKQMPLYLLVTDKAGPKLTAHDDARPKSRGGCGRLVGRRVTMDAIATMLSRRLEREVLNRTGITGEYDVQLEFRPDSGPCRTAATGQGDSVAGDPAGLPFIYPAVQQQLGLRLQSGKGPVELLVIDRVDKPSDN